MLINDKIYKNIRQRKYSLISLGGQSSDELTYTLFELMVKLQEEQPPAQLQLSQIFNTQSFALCTSFLHLYKENHRKYIQQNSKLNTLFKNQVTFFPLTHTWEQTFSKLTLRKKFKYLIFDSYGFNSEFMQNVVSWSKHSLLAYPELMGIILVASFQHEAQIDNSELVIQVRREGLEIVKDTKAKRLA